jgi:hypothetical protein
MKTSERPKIQRSQRSEETPVTLINEVVYLSCHGDLTSSPCLFRLKKFPSKIEICDQKNIQEMILYEFPLSSILIIPLMSPTSFSIDSNGQNFEIICPSSSIVRRIFQAIEEVSHSSSSPS